MATLEGTAYITMLSIIDFPPNISVLYTDVDLVVSRGRVLHPSDGHIIASSSSTRYNQEDARHLLEPSSTTMEDHNLNSHIANDAYLTSPHESV